MCFMLSRNSDIFYVFKNFRYNILPFQFICIEIVLVRVLSMTIIDIMHIYDIILMKDPYIECNISYATKDYFRIDITLRNCGLQQIRII